MAQYGGYEGYPPGADPYAATYGGYAPVPGAYPPAAGYPDEVRTIFITGFPQDVKERELNNLLRFLTGYEASQMNWKNGQAQGFALFSTHALARTAIDAISQLCFDETSVLRCEMAHKNMYLKDDPTAKRVRTAGEFRPPFPGGGGSLPVPAAGSGAPPVRPVGYVPINNQHDNPPCNTLFIGNLGDNVSEAELRGLFTHQPGFLQLKLVRGARSTSCFVEFADVATAMAVHQSQQGAILASSDRGGVRIQFSKNPFGKKRDASGNLVETARLNGE